MREFMWPWLRCQELLASFLAFGLLSEHPLGNMILVLWHVLLLLELLSLFSRVRLFATPWTAACQVSLSFTISHSLLMLTSIESMMPFNHLILCLLFLVMPSIFPSTAVFSNESVLPIRWPKYWSFSISPSIEYSILGFLAKLPAKLLLLFSCSILDNFVLSEN